MVCVGLYFYFYIFFDEGKLGGVINTHLGKFNFNVVHMCMFEKKI